jgi:hypothetical protein
MAHHQDTQNLNPEQGQLLVKLARKTLSEQLAKQIPQNETDSLNTALSDPCFNLTGNCEDVSATLLPMSPWHPAFAGMPSMPPFMTRVFRR